MKIDGFTSLLCFFNNDVEAFTNHFIRNVYFFDKESVAKQAKEILDKKMKLEKIPVRYSKQFIEFYETDPLNMDSISIKVSNAEEAYNLSNNNNIYLKGTKIKIIVDRDGNRLIRSEIKKYTGHKVSDGAKSNIVNCTISHIWANTYHPLYFSLMWNIAIVPTYLNPIMDKPDSNSDLIRNIQDLMKAICYELYKPNELMNDKLVDQPSPEIKEQAVKFINNGVVKFLPKNETNKTEGRKVRSNVNANLNHEQTQIDKVKNKVPRWFNRPQQISSRILIGFMQLLDGGESVSYNILYEKCNVINSFKTNFDSMIDFGDKNHGKVFEQIGSDIFLWAPIREFVISEYSKYLRNK